MSIRFTIRQRDAATHARAGELQTDHGVILTPIFMPVGTAATVTVPGSVPVRKAPQPAKKTTPSSKSHISCLNS